MKTKQKKSDKNASEKSKSGELDATNEHLLPSTKDQIAKDTREKISLRFGGRKLISFYELKQTHPAFAGWLEEIVRYSNVDKTCIILSDINLQPTKFVNDDLNNFEIIPIKPHEIRVCVKFYTADHEYSISARVPSHNEETGDFDGGYLGCIVNKRKPRVGEHWTRGNDLPDGKYNKETWNKILNRILAYEIKNLQVEI